MFGKTLFESLLWAPLRKIGKYGPPVIMATLALCFRWPDFWLTKIMVISSVSYLVLFAMAVYHALNQSARISLAEKLVSHDRDMSAIAPRIEDLVQEIGSEGKFVEQKAKSLLSVVSPALNQGASLEVLNDILSGSRIQGYTQQNLFIATRLDYDSGNEDSSDFQWVYPKSAKLVIYRGKKALAELVLFKI